MHVQSLLIALGIILLQSPSSLADSSDQLRSHILQQLSADTAAEDSPLSISGGSDDTNICATIANPSDADCSSSSSWSTLCVPQGCPSEDSSDLALGIPVCRERTPGARTLECMAYAPDDRALTYFTKNLKVCHFAYKDLTEEAKMLTVQAAQMDLKADELKNKADGFKDAWREAGEKVRAAIKTRDQAQIQEANEARQSVMTQRMDVLRERSEVLRQRGELYSQRSKLLPEECPEGQDWVNPNKETPRKDSLPPPPQPKTPQTTTTVDPTEAPSGSGVAEGQEVIGGTKNVTPSPTNEADGVIASSKMVMLIVATMVAMIM